MLCSFPHLLVVCYKVLLCNVLFSSIYSLHDVSFEQKAIIMSYIYLIICCGHIESESLYPSLFVI
uniref:Putative ovule protein n=1 Tax=Solanum chacoense TaxID=4108 RepID=A0A0V0GE86_SOLCH